MNSFTTALNRALGRPDEAAPYDGRVHPEPGEWVYDRPKGMKPVSKPEPLPAGEIDNEEVRHHVRRDGLGHCIYSLIPGGKIQDEQLKRKWFEARNAMMTVLLHLEDHK